MSNDPKTVGGNPASVGPREKGVKIFTYPKIIFIFPTLVMSLICWIGMWMVSEDANRSTDPTVSTTQLKKAGVAKPAETGISGKADVIPAAGPVPTGQADPKRFRSTGNVLGLIFLGVLFFNLMILAIDFPRFTIFALILLGTTVLFFLLWLGVFVNILEPLERAFQSVFVYSNAQFYFIFSMIILVIYALIFTTRWLDYWEILPNEILHHHGPLADLERYPTTNLKFDKEIPDVFEHLMAGAGRLILHVTNEHKAIILDTVLHVSRKEEALKKLMSRMEVRVTTDQEVAGSP